MYFIWQICIYHTHTHDDVYAIAHFMRFQEMSVLDERQCVGYEILLILLHDISFEHQTVEIIRVRVCVRGLGRVCA